MLNKINQFFRNLAIEPSETEQPLDVEVACAVLLFEVINADGELTTDEQTKLRQIIEQHFDLTSAEVKNVIEQAQQLSHNANDFHRFTSQLNNHYASEEKVLIVSLLWQLAHADGTVSSIEEHTIRKIADLLYLRHAEYIRAKLEAIPK